MTPDAIGRTIQACISRQCSPKNELDSRKFAFALQTFSAPNCAVGMSFFQMCPLSDSATYSTAQNRSSAWSARAQCIRIVKSASLGLRSVYFYTSAEVSMGNDARCVCLGFCHAESKESYCARTTDAHTYCASTNLCSFYLTMPWKELSPNNAKNTFSSPTQSL